MVLLAFACLLTTLPTLRAAAQDIVAPPAQVHPFVVLRPEVFRAELGDDAAWITANAPLFECPDRKIEQIYYYRWHVFHEHLKQTPAGWIVTEFLPDVPWAGKYNSISCAAGHHLREARWLRDQTYAADYSRFWFRADGNGGEPRRYSFWAADSVYSVALASGDRSLAIELLPNLIANYEAWEKDHRDSNGLFWQIDDRDGMEYSIGGSGCRPTINSYQYGDALAIAHIAEWAGKPDIASDFQARAATIKSLVQTRLWDPQAQFFKTLPRGNGKTLAAVREEVGFIPWYFDLPDSGGGFESAWSQLTDPQGFAAPFGPLTAERRSPRFNFAANHDCLWNGPSWPFATTQTLVALANLLNDYPQKVIRSSDYLSLLKAYASSQYKDGAPHVAEDLDGDTGRWIVDLPRSVDYNHSGFCDLIITSLAGLRPSCLVSASGGDVLVVNPLIPTGAMDWFCLDGVPYHGHSITIFYDKTGDRYHQGAGLSVLCDGKRVAHAESIERVKATLDAAQAATHVVTGFQPAAANIVPLADAKPDASAVSSETAESAGGWMKFQNNPVLGGKLGTCFDIAVLKEANVYRMYFSWRPKQSVALTESNDGIHWSQPQIVLGPLAATGWEDDMNRPVVVKKDDGYHMWYTGQAHGHSAIGYAVSPDGKTWTRKSQTPVLSAEASWEKVAVMCPHVIWDAKENQFKMWYSGGEQYEPDAIGYATSPDGLKWTKLAANPIFRADPAVSWEQHKVTACQVVPDGGGYLMFYIGFHDTDHAAIGIARSKDGITDWKRCASNPILQPGKDKWDADACYKPFAIYDDKSDKWLLWYNGRRGGVEQIGMATHEGKDLGK
jgi:predicted GH43/DUF377 family glycosyl hydrolase